MPLSLSFDVEPDADGIIDGRDLARQLIGEAFTALVPYVNGCHACADTLFGVIANEVMAELHEQGHLRGKLDAVVYRPGLDVDDAAFTRHFAAAMARTRTMLGGDEDAVHQH